MLPNIGDKVCAVKNGITMVGTVTDWRCKYGTDIQFSVRLDVPVKYRWRDEPVFDVVITDKDIMV